MSFQLIYKAAPAPDPNAIPFNLMDWLKAHGALITAIIGIGKLVWVAIYGHPWSDQVDTIINTILIALFGTSVFQGAAQTATAHVVNSIINPTSPTARKMARMVTPPPEEHVDTNKLG